MPTLVAYVLLFTAIGAFFIFIHLVIGRFVRPNRPDAEKLTVYECGEPTIGSAWVQFDLRFYVVALLFVIFDVEMAFFFPWAVVFGKANSLASDTITPAQRVEYMTLLDPEQKANLTDEAMHQADVERKEKFFSGLVAEMESQLRDPAASRAEIKKQKTELQQKIDKLPADSPDRASLQTQMVSLETKESRLSNLESMRNRLGQIKRDGPELSQRDAAINLSKPVSSSFAWIAFGDILVFFAVLLVGFAYLWRRGDLNWVRSIAAQQEDNADQARELANSPV
jgi:NADH-quinone oxidoreductase subunit A